MTLSALLVSVDQASTQLLQKVLEEGSIRFECCTDFVSAGIPLVQEITNYTIGYWMLSPFPELGQVLNPPSNHHNRAHLISCPGSDRLYAIRVFDQSR